MVSTLLWSCVEPSVPSASAHPGDLQRRPRRDSNAHIQVRRHQRSGKDTHAHTRTDAHARTSAKSSGPTSCSSRPPSGGGDGLQVKSQRSRSSDCAFVDNTQTQSASHVPVCRAARDAFGLLRLVPGRTRAKSRGRGGGGRRAEGGQRPLRHPTAPRLSRCCLLTCHPSVVRL